MSEEVLPVCVEKFKNIEKTDCERRQNIDLLFKRIDALPADIRESMLEYKNAVDKSIDQYKEYIKEYISSTIKVSASGVVMILALQIFAIVKGWI